MDHRLQIATTETQTMPADLMLYIYLFGRVLCKYANIDHFVSQSGQGACKINAERKHCIDLFWNAVVMFNEKKIPIASVDLWNRAHNFIMFLAEIDKGLSVLWSVKCVYNRVIAVSKLPNG